MYYLLFYDVVDDYVARRAALRSEHLALAGAARDRGDLALAGALDEPVDGAVLVFDVDDASTVDAFVRDDPYVQHGLVTAWRVRKWTVVAGTALPA